MIKIALGILIFAFLSGCSEPVEKKAIDKANPENNIQLEEKKSLPNEKAFIEKDRYKKVNVNDYNILIDSSLSKLISQKDYLKKNISSKVNLHSRHFFIDSDILKNKFDSAILIDGSPLEKSIKNKKKISKVGEDRLVLAVNKELIPLFGEVSNITFDKIKKITKENEIKIQIANPALNIPSFYAWINFSSENFKNNSMSSKMTHGSYRKIIEGLNKEIFSTAWMMESTSKKIVSSFQEQEKELPYVFYFIEGKQFYAQYSLYKLNQGKNDTFRKLENEISSDKFKDNLSNYLKINTGKGNYSRIYKENMENRKRTNELVNEIDRFLDSSYPNIHTVFLIPNSNSDIRSELLNQFVHTLDSLNSKEQNIYEKISRARNNEKVSIILYSKGHDIVIKNRVLESLTLEELKNKIVSPISNEIGNPYGSVFPALSYSKEMMLSNNTVRIVHVATENMGTVELTNSEYAEFAEKYKRSRLEGLYPSELEVSNIGMAKALMENLNGFTGLSNGIHVDGNKTQFKKAIFIIKNNY